MYFSFYSTGCFPLLQQHGKMHKYEVRKGANTSPAPRNKNVWLAKLPLMSFKAATTPARTTDAVP